MHQQGAHASAQSRQHLNSHVRALGLSYRESLAMVAVWVHTWSLSAVLQGVPMGSLISPVVRHMLQQQSMSTTSIKGSSAGLTALACSQLPAADMSRHRLLNQPLCNAPECSLWAATAESYRDTLAQGLCSQQQLVQSPWVLPVARPGLAQGMCCTAGGCHAPPRMPCSPSCAAEEGEGCEDKGRGTVPDLASMCSAECIEACNGLGRDLPKQCSSLSQRPQRCVTNNKTLLPIAPHRMASAQTAFLVDSRLTCGCALFHVWDMATVRRFLQAAQ